MKMEEVCTDMVVANYDYKGIFEKISKERQLSRASQNDETSIDLIVKMQNFRLLSLPRKRCAIISIVFNNT